MDLLKIRWPRLKPGPVPDVPRGMTVPSAEELIQPVRHEHWATALLATCFWEWQPVSDRLGRLLLLLASTQEAQVCERNEIAPTNEAQHPKSIMEEKARLPTPSPSLPPREVLLEQAPAEQPKTSLGPPQSSRPTRLPDVVHLSIRRRRLRCALRDIEGAAGDRHRRRADPNGTPASGVRSDTKAATASQLVFWWTRHNSLFFF